MQFNDKQLIEGFKCIDTQPISEIKGQGHVFIHESTGITIICLENRDTHKVFSINLLTPPIDNKGTAHIVEHAVCCASQKYPLKETFVAAGQGSVCTTMNACTYPDRTMYYVSSPIEKDLLGIAEVYMDLVFHPMITQDSQYFLQEGWHYVAEDGEELDISGVVYNEMLSEYGDAYTYLKHYEAETLFKDCCYRYDSGGIPESIIELQEKEFLDFYKTHYNGNNTVIITYGDINIPSFLRKLQDKCLYHINSGHKIVPPALQKPFEKPLYQVCHYPVQQLKEPTLLSLSFVVGDNLSCEQRLAFEILEHMLIKSSASPLLQRLIIEEKLASSLSDVGYDSCRRQPTFTITLQGGSKEKALLFEQIVFEELTKIVENGIDQELLAAALETLEFQLKETDSSYEPIGILYSEMILNSYLYGGKPFTHLSYEKALTHIKSNQTKGYFEKLIKKYLLNNPHRVLTVLVPDCYLYDERNKTLQRQIQQYQANCLDGELKHLKMKYKELKEKQLEENTKEALDLLPKLTLEDMPQKLPTLKINTYELEKTKVVFHEETTQDIVYIHFLWEVNHIQEISELGLFAHIFTYMGTKDKSYVQIENDINTYTGGIQCSVNTYLEETSEKYISIFKVSVKVLHEHLDKFKTLIIELLTNVCFREKEKLRELIGDIVYEWERSLSGAPEYRATQRMYAYLGYQGAYDDKVSGIAFYKMVKDLYDNFDERYMSLINKLDKIIAQLFCKQTLSVCVTGNNSIKDKVEGILQQVVNSLPDLILNEALEPILKPVNGNEGIFNGQESQTVALGAYFKTTNTQYKGQYEVVCNVLESTYLWDRVRLQGGAYGAEITLSKEGYIILYSYCDPHLDKTIAIYEGISSYLRKVQLDKETIERAVITTLGAMIAPLSVEQKSERVCLYSITGMTQEKRQLLYEQIRKTTLDDFREMADIFDLVRKEGLLCIIGNKNKIISSKHSLSLIDLDI